jgi:hypothetical protein
MRDQDIRCSLRQELVAAYGCDSSTLIVDELGICCGMARVDVAVVNGELKGFEIKSEKDTLGRLPAQSDMYGKVFDTMSIVLGLRHLHGAESFLPNWWGIVVADRNEDGFLHLQRVRRESNNTDQDALSIVQLLWRDEALALLHKAGLSAGLRNRPRRYLWEALALNFCLSDLRGVVREQLKLRRNWRVAASRTLCGGRSPLSAKSSDSRYSLNDLRSR